jgi:acetoacetate decarboxylase
MRPNLEYGESLLPNEDKFQDPFFRRFRLRKAPAPFPLDEKVSKDYQFPIFYADAACAMGVFMCDYARAQAVLPHPKIKPVRMTRGRSLVLFSCYEYRNVMNVKPYNEIVMTIPVMADPRVNVPVLPMVTPFFRKFGYYAFGISATSKENAIRGSGIWGLPKVTREVDIFREEGECVAIARDESGVPYFELRVPMSGSAREFDVKTSLYSQLDGQLLRSEVCFKGSFQVNKYMKCLARKGLKPGRACLRLGDTPAARSLKDLGIEEHPFQFRYAEHLDSTLDLPDAGFRL